jgi:2-dehydro-3-deoxy-D-arabinonate dehydratase
MSLCRYMTYAPVVGRQKRWGWLREDRVYPLDEQAVTNCFVSPDEEGLVGLARAVSGESIAYSELDVTPGRYGYPSLLAPLTTGQEVWAAGVTYESSKFARMAESNEGGDFYARVYVADRPELFFKATPNRTVGPNDAVRVRADSRWNVPEPELAVVLAANGQILGYTVGNDMSSRDIEGENPLYLPQAKVYRASCGLGPVIVPAQNLDPHMLAIRLTITRNSSPAYSGETSTARMRRKVQELAEWLFLENEFPHGVVMLTGTGLIPPDDFSLQAGDEVAIEIDGIGVLKNRVE